MWRVGTFRRGSLVRGSLFCSRVENGRREVCFYVFCLCSELVCTKTTTTRRIQKINYVMENNGHGNRWWWHTYMVRGYRSWTGCATDMQNACAQTSNPSKKALETTVNQSNQSAMWCTVQMIHAKTTSNYLYIHKWTWSVIQTLRSEAVINIPTSSPARWMQHCYGDWFLSNVDHGISQVTLMFLLLATYPTFLRVFLRDPKDLTIISFLALPRAIPIQKLLNLNLRLKSSLHGLSTKTAVGEKQWQNVGACTSSSKSTAAWDAVPLSMHN